MSRVLREDVRDHLSGGSEGGYRVSATVNIGVKGQQVNRVPVISQHLISVSTSESNSGNGPNSAKKQYSEKERVSEGQEERERDQLGASVEVSVGGGKVSGLANGVNLKDAQRSE